MTTCLTGIDILNAIAFDMLLASLVGATLGFVLGAGVMYSQKKG